MEPTTDFAKTSHSTEPSAEQEYASFHNLLKEVIDGAREPGSFDTVTRFADHARRLTKDMLNLYDRNDDPRFPLTADELANNVIQDIAELR